MRLALIGLCNHFSGHNARLSYGHTYYSQLSPLSSTLTVSLGLFGFISSTWNEMIDSKKSGLDSRYVAKVLQPQSCTHSITSHRVSVSATSLPPKKTYASKMKVSIGCFWDKTRLNFE